MSGIVLNSSQNNISAQSVPLYADWNVNPGSINIQHYQGAEMPEPIMVNLRFKDVLGTSAVNGLTNITYRTYVGIVPAYPVCIVQSGELHTGTEVNEVYQNGLEGVLQYDFQNLNLLEPGTYLWRVRYQVRGVKPNGVFGIAAEYILNVNVTIYPSAAPLISTAALNFVWTMGQSTWLYQQITISGPMWQVAVPSGWALSSSPGMEVTPLPGYHGYVASGSGTITFSVIASPGVEPDIITENPKQFFMVVNGGIINVPLNVTYLQGSGLFIAKEQLHFVAYKGITNAYPQFVQAYYQGQYNFSVPPWLTVNPHPASYSNNLGFYVVSADNMEPGTYTAMVEVYRQFDGYPLGTIEVIYDVIGVIELPYPQYGFGFTLDNDFIGLISQHEDSYFEVDLHTKVYEYYSQNFREKTLSFKYPVFNKRQKFNIGRVVDRLMFSLPDFIQEGAYPYLPAEVSMDIREKRNSDPNYLMTYQVENIQFVAGVSPEMVNGCGILDINPHPARATPKGIAYLNLIISNFPTVQIYKNGQLANQYGVTTGIRSIRLDFNNLGAAPGDVIEYRLVTSTGQSVSKFYKIFPEGEFSNLLIWENEYKLKSALECTGKFDLSSEFENRNELLIDNLVDALRKIESTKTVKLTINTGFVLKSDQGTIESLCRAKRAALLVDGKAISLIPVQKNMVNYDADQELYSYDLEFEINRTYNEEIYPF